MSQIVGGGNGLGGWVSPEDPNNRMRPNYWVLPDQYWRPDDFCLNDFYSGGWWPGSGGPMTDSPSPFGDILSAVQWEQPEKISGSSGRWGIVGVTRDVYGSPLGGVTVKLFRTADDTLQETLVSDPSGNYLITTPFYPDTHYIVARKSGSPDVQGVTVNTLVGG